MSISLKFYQDAALATPLDVNPITLDRAIGGDPVDAVVYLGSTIPSRQFTADAGGQISISLTDSAVGGFAPTDITLALTQAGLDTALPGAPIAVAMQITSGAANAIPVWLRFTGTSATPLTSTELGLITNTVREFAQ